MLARGGGHRLATIGWPAAGLRPSPPPPPTRSCLHLDASLTIRRGLSSAGGAPGPKRDPVDTRTPLDEALEMRRIERRIREHVQEHGPGALPDMSSEVTDSGAVTPGADVPSESGAAAAQEAVPTAVPSAPNALRIQKPAASVPDAAGAKDVVVRSRTTTGQVLWPATKEDIEILSDSKLMYPAPYEVEGSVIIRLVRLSDPVTSPVARVVRNRQFGIRGNEKWQLLGMGVVCALGVYGLGIWQLRRMEWKKNLIEMRRTRLSMPRLSVNSSPFPWKDAVDDYVYRIVDVRGVFDYRREMLVGPRPGSDETGETKPGFLSVTPLRLEDGSTVLVNRGHVTVDKVDPGKRQELPTWVRIRGVLEEGEIANVVGRYARLKNRPADGQFVYLVASDLAENAGARNHQECSQALITAFDVLFEDDFKAGVRRTLPFSMRQKEDYLLFWADEHTHFNYAMQWFGMGSLILGMTIYKFIEVVRWRW
eukprot:gnl/TRDRNA2_/TRDRNA2_196305_c0_seq1.p1 gnl/TRDRNA2_/TRDRNA2_196305_c0~~gnl/TRDRNA2_/TRDRNA2_196305_c0_seq1.p1  ORF type:complete len:480 (+),score=68.75 gnl/TRDRNA2_/TRDRNA2_196305_c0_seq1:110-1549(+)